MPPGNRPNPPQHVMHFLVHGLIYSQAWANSFWVRNGSLAQPTPQDFETMTHAIHGIYGNAFASHIGGTTTIEGVNALYYGTTGADLGAEWNEQIACTEGSGAPLSAQVATGISWKVQAHYKGGHPRTYLVGPTAGQLQNPRAFKDTFASAVAGAANDFLEDVNATVVGNISDVHLGTVSFVLRNEWRTPPVFRDYIPTAASVDIRPDTIRHRLGRDL